MTNIKIIKCKLVEDESPYKIVGFNVQNNDGSNCIYHETILTNEQIQGKTDNECVDLAFEQMSSSIATSIQKIEQSQNDIVGSYYVP